MELGLEVSLIPTYTPIRVDETNQSQSQVLLGGVNLYLDHASPIWRRIPRALTRWLDRPWAINLATSFGMSSDAERLGPLTVSMLQGSRGPHRRQVEEFAEFFGGALQPDVVCLSNILLGGVLEPLKARFPGPVFCLLQGDDVFLDALQEPYRSQALERIRAHAQLCDGFLVHSEYYQRFMARYLELDERLFHRLPLGIDLDGHDGSPEQAAQGQDEFVVGYFARICPEKGLRELAQAFRILQQRVPQARLRVGGYLKHEHVRYFEDVRRSCRDWGFDFDHVGSPDTHATKVEYLKSLDVLSVPATYQEPKGLYVLEALANGVPVVQPDHGAFPELVERTAGGLLVAPGDPQQLAVALEQLFREPATRRQMGATGQQRVQAQFNMRVMAERSRDVFTEALAGK
jgi:glycosyltransferase involved in cell wall biosynthesis